jgi:hypothetical protein
MASPTVGIVIAGTGAVVCGAAAALLLIRGDRVAQWNNRNMPGVRAQAPTMRFLGWFLATLTVLLSVASISQA